MKKTSNLNPRQAVIYARVSSAKQMSRGDGLNSQEVRCREYARFRGLEVLKVFADDMTGSTANRPAMKDMIGFVRKRKALGTVVIIDDISRFARGLEAHLQLRSDLLLAGGKLESPSIEFGEDSDSILIENLLASVSQHQREKNADQTLNRMRSRLQSGYAVFAAAIGYRYERVSGQGKMLLRHEPYASILQEAFEGFASGRFETQAEVKRFLESMPDWPKCLPNGEVRNQRVSDLLTRPIYAGMVEAPEWDVSRRLGKHEGIISVATFERMQERLTEAAKAPARKDINVDFPLRGFIICDDCSKPLSSCWSKSKSGEKHPYYFCFNKGCVSCRKSIRRAELEGAFDEVVRTLQPTENLMKIAGMMFKDAWDQRFEQATEILGSVKRDVARLEKQIEQVLSRIMESSNATVIAAYEKRIEGLENEKLILADRLKQQAPSKDAYADLFELSMTFLASPWKLWEKGDFVIKRTVLRLAFSERVAYSRKTGLRTPKSAIPFKVLAAIGMGENEMAHRNGDVHIHDLDCLTGYCAGWSLRALLNDGFNGVGGRVSSRPPRHFREALGQMSNFLGILQSEWAGAQAFSSFDTYLAPYVFYDQLSFKEVKKAIRQFVYNLNVPARWGQSPFTNITLDITVPEDLQNQIPTYNNLHLFKGIKNDELLLKAQQRDMGLRSLEDTTFKHFAPEMEMINIAYYEVMTEGDSTGQPFTFPIPTVNITEDFDWDSKVAAAIFENTAKVGSSYFQNFVGSQWMKNEKGERVRNPEAYSPGAVRSMCCRLQLDLRELLKRGNGLFGSAEMTGSIGVVTLNMARLGYLYKGDFKGLMGEVDRLMDIGKSTLEKKRVFAQKMYDRGLYPYTSRYLPFFRNHFSTIGVNGMNEMIRNFTGDEHDITDEQGIQMSLDILDHMRTKLLGYQEETGNLYNLEATPAEGTTYRFAKEDKKRFPDILQAGFGENIYYTNSSQIPANHTEDPFEALELQNRLQCKYTGGTVLHLYMNEKLSSAEACKGFVKKVIGNYQLPYITVTPVFSVCDTHGYLNGEQPECPTCGENTKVWTRVMGYFRPVDSFNKGKQGEHRERKHFKEDWVDTGNLFTGV